MMYLILSVTIPDIMPNIIWPTTCSTEIPLTSNGLPIKYCFGRQSSDIGNRPITEKDAESPAYTTVENSTNLSEFNRFIVFYSFIFRNRIVFVVIMVSSKKLESDSQTKIKKF